jgi:hypothetical protein
VSIIAIGLSLVVGSVAATLVGLALRRGEWLVAAINAVLVVINAVIIVAELTLK